ncbi:MAG TPA: hypothetical protein VHX13_03095 [Acidobacteriaceae bacterium]|jgi:hypothetical protein|nr:hypothetical protein [Acidobacteriaceae bacterium]
MRIGKSNLVLEGLCLALLLAPGLHAQNVVSVAVSLGAEPAAVVPVAVPAGRSSVPSLGFCDWTLLGAATGLRYLDYQTTVKALSDPANFHEVELPQPLVDNHPAFGAFEAGTVAANYWIYRMLVRHGHRRLARAGQLINLGALGGTVAFNEYNLARYYRQTPH